MTLIKIWLKISILNFIAICLLLPLSSCRSTAISRKLTSTATPTRANPTIKATGVTDTANPAPEQPLTVINTPATSSLIPTFDPPTPAATQRSYYLIQSGDSLPVVAARFQLSEQELTFNNHNVESGYLPAGEKIWLPDGTTIFAEIEPFMPDSEFLYSPSAVDFDVAAYLSIAGGFFASHQEYLRSSGWTSAADIIQRVALENSINPRFLLSILEYETQAVFGQPGENINIEYMLGNEDFHRKGFYLQLSWLADQLSVGYYGWRAGTLMEIQVIDGTMYRPSPYLNAGSVGLIYYYAQKHVLAQLVEYVDPERGLPGLHASMFGDPWPRAAEVEPLLPPGLSQPLMQLPFEVGKLWSYTSGPHPAWEKNGALAALDFAPASAESGCVSSKAWVTAVADGMVVRTGAGIVIQDIDPLPGQESDGLEQTGWVILYMHIEERERIESGTRLKAGDRIGHPSCEGGPANGTHVHIARKFNGEWILAGGPIPFILDGWVAIAGDKPYEGILENGSQIRTAHPNGSIYTQITRPDIIEAE